MVEQITIRSPTSKSRSSEPSCWTIPTLMPEDRPRLHTRHRSPNKMQIRSAYGRRRQLDDRVRRLLDPRVGNILQTDIADVVPDNCFHAFTSAAARRNAGRRSPSAGAASAMRDRPARAGRRCCATVDVKLVLSRCTPVRLGRAIRRTEYRRSERNAVSRRHQRPRGAPAFALTEGFYCVACRTPRPRRRSRGRSPGAWTRALKGCCE